jgi:hypothetical protein
MIGAGLPATCVAGPGGRRRRRSPRPKPPARADRSRTGRSHSARLCSDVTVDSPADRPAPTPASGKAGRSENGPVRTRSRASGCTVRRVRSPGRAARSTRLFAGRLGAFTRPTRAAVFVAATASGGVRIATRRIRVTASLGADTRERTWAAGRPFEPLAGRAIGRIRIAGGAPSGVGATEVVASDTAVAADVSAVCATASAGFSSGAVFCGATGCGGAGAVSIGSAGVVSAWAPESSGGVGEPGFAVGAAAVTPCAGGVGGGVGSGAGSGTDWDSATDVDRGGRNPSGSKYPFGSAVRRTPRWT